jgi:hypothetical protein
MKTLQASSANTLSEISENTEEAAGNAASSNAKWPIKEKLYLVSFILVHGDSDWPFIASQLNKWIGTTYSSIQSGGTAASKLATAASTSAAIAANLNKKTIAVK